MRKLPQGRQSRFVGRTSTTNTMKAALGPALRSAVGAVVESLESRTLLSTSVLTYHNNNQSTGVNNTETLLTTASVNVSQFQKQFSVPLDGQEYSQPLYDPGVNITTGNQPGVHNVIYVTTQHDSLYAIDSNGGSVLWHDSFIYQGVGNANPNPLNPIIPAGVTTMPSGDTGSGDISPEIGIVATPVIDPATNAMFLTAKTKQIDAGNFTHYVYTLYKINIQNGAIIASTTIGDTINNGGAYSYRVTSTGSGTDPYVNGTGDGSITSQAAIDGQVAGNWGGTRRVYFNAQRQMDRPGVVLANGSIYLAFASHGDNGPYHGWVLRYDPSTLALTGVVNTTPNGGLGGIWGGGGITSIDAAGNLYCETGNGSFNTAASNFTGTNNGTTYSLPLDHNYGDCFIKISTDTTHNSPTNQNSNGWGLQISDFFSPYNNATLNGGDTDLGSGAPVVLPDAVGSALHPHLLVGAGKEGKIYLLDRDHMGGFTPATDQVVETQAYTATSGINGSLNTPAFFLNGAGGTSGTLYYFPGYGGDGRAFSVSNGQFSANYTSHTTDAASFGSLDGTPSISANGTTNGIVWVIDRGTNTLRSYSAANLSIALWNSNAAANSRDALGAVTKFSVPTVADGIVMVGTLTSLVVYGPPVAPTTGPAAPSGLAASAFNYQTVNLSWVDNSNNESQFNIERSPAGQNAWVQIGLASANATTYTDTTTQAATAYDYRIRAFNSFNGGTFSAYANTAAPVTTPNAPPIGTGDGALGAYYNDVNNVHLSGTPTLTRVDPQINFNWDTGSPGPGIGVDHFSAKWTGQIQPQFSEVYTFYTESDDGVRLFVNGVQLINNFTDHGPTEDTGTTSVALSAGQKYSFEMDFYENGGGAVAQLLWSSAHTIKDFIPKSQLYSGATPAAPSNLAGTPSSGTQINLSWNDNSNNETGFDLERQVVGNGTFQQIGGGPLPANTTSFMDTGLTPGVTYAYEIRALNFGGNSAYVPQPPLQITAPTPPNKPTNAHATSNSTTQIAIAWTDTASNEDGFRVLRSAAGADFFQIALLPANSTSYVDNGANGAGLTPGTEYEYHVQAYNIAGYNDFTGTDTATLTVAPSGLTSTPGNGQITLSWTAPSYNAANSTQLTFNVYRGISPGAEVFTPIATELTSPTFTDTGLTNGQAYYYKVTAVEVGGESAKSAETSAITASAIAARQLFYNNSYWTNPANGFTNDDAAIDTSKTALLNGGTATFANYSGSSKGINGIMIDIAGLPTGTPAATDFTFKIGNDSTPSGWATAPNPTNIIVRRGAGTGGSDRIELIWADNAIQNTWLQVTVKANTATGLATPDISYFGNAIAETGNNVANASVNSGDIIAVRDHPTSSQNPALVTNPYDFNHDTSVSSADMIIARDHPSSSSTELHLIAPTAPAPAAPAAAAPTSASASAAATPVIVASAPAPLVAPTPAPAPAPKPAPVPIPTPAVKTQPVVVATQPPKSAPASSAATVFSTTAIKQPTKRARKHPWWA